VARPLIGVTRCSRLDDYLASVEKAGGRTRILEVSESPRKLVQEIDGLLLTGGGDVDPALYGQPRHPATDDAEPGRDEFEIDLARRAMTADLPVLAICRGTQVLNVAAGGTLVQDIPSEVGSELRHTITEPRDAVAHPIRIAHGSRLARALGGAVEGAGGRQVNSRHHQSVDRLGSDLTSVATAPDGIVEAIENESAAYCIGVQWHPENFLRTGEFAPLFESFIDAARARLGARTGDGQEDGRGEGDATEGAG
jgi:putative glutamine amidotransferase